MLQTSRWLRRLLALIGAISSTLLLAQPVRLAHGIGDTHVAILPGSLHPNAQARYDQGPEDPSRNLPYMTLSLKPSPAQQAALDKLLGDQQDRSSPGYHKWLTPEQFGDRFGLAPSDYATVSAWIESRGLHIERTARARTFVAFSGSVQLVERAFHTSIHRYLVNGETYFANATQLSIPEALQDMCSGIRGLDDFARPLAAPGPQNTSNRRHATVAR
jgi:subtilase family serine protease